MVVIRRYSMGLFVGPVPGQPEEARRMKRLHVPLKEHEAKCSCWRCDTGGLGGAFYVRQSGCCVDGSCDSKTCMDLPEGKTCGDCVYVKRCVSMFGHTITDTYCDWFPRRFRAPDV